MHPALRRYVEPPGPRTARYIAAGAACGFAGIALALALVHLAELRAGNAHQDRIEDVRPPERRVTPAVARGRYRLGGAAARRHAVAVLALTGVLGVTAAVTAPRVMRCFCESKEDIARATIKRYAYEAFPSWQLATGEQCPPDLRTLNEWMNNRDIRNPWGRDYQFRCTDGRIVVWSSGPGADIRSDR